MLDDGVRAYSTLNLRWNDLTGQLFPQVSGNVIAVQNAPESYSAVAGTVTGDVSMLVLQDDVYFVVNEVAATPGFSVEFTFQDTTKTADSIQFRARYEGTNAHTVNMDAYDVTNATWRNCTVVTWSGSPSVPSNTALNLGGGNNGSFVSGIAKLPTTVTDYFDSNGRIKLRFQHTSAGTATHKLYVDQLLVLRKAYVPVLMLVASTGIRGLKFPGTFPAETSISGSIELAHGYCEGTNLLPHVHWMPTTSSSGDVKLYLDWAWIDPFGTFSTATTAYALAAAGGTAWVEKRSNFDDGAGSGWAGLSGTGHKIGGRFLYRFRRDPNDAADTYPDPIVVYDIQVHADFDAIGSRGVGTK